MAREDRIVAISIDVNETSVTINKGPNNDEIEPIGPGAFFLDENGDPHFWVIRRKEARTLEPITRLVVRPTVDGLVDLTSERHYFGTVILPTGAVHAFVRFVRGT